MLRFAERAECFSNPRLSPACARKLIEGAVAYARSLGLEPHSDYWRGARVFGGINPDDCQQEFVYGKDGKPLFVQSPNDSPQFAERVMAILTRRLGAGGYHYVLPLGGIPSSWADDVNEADAEAAGPDRGVDPV